MLKRGLLFSGLVLGLAVAATVSPAAGQEGRGRKYKAPPDTSHIEVLVLKDSNKKPVVNAAVVFHSSMDGKDEGNLEVKTDDQGVAMIDVIPTGSSVDVQVIAPGFATFANTYLVSEASRSIEIRLIRPRAQISTYVDTRGEAAQRPIGVQEPNHPHSAPDIQAAQPTNRTSDSTATAPGAINYTPPKAAAPQQGVPVQTNPPNLHPDSQYPIDPANAPQRSSQPPSTPKPPQI